MKRSSVALTAVHGSPRLWKRREEERTAFFTEAAGAPPVVYGERTIALPTTTLRHWDPSRSKLGAALAKGWDGPVPRAGERWLYLGAATGTTASHVADLVAPAGAVYAVERSLRSFARLLRTAERYPNLFPVLGDARRPEEIGSGLPAVDGVYVDVAQPDQVEIAWTSAREFLRSSGVLLLALKTASMGRGLEPLGHLHATTERLGAGFELFPPLGLEPFHRRHYLVAGQPTRRLFSEDRNVPAVTGSRAGRRAARRP